VSRRKQRAGSNQAPRRPTNYVALVTAGLISVIVFPLVALTLLRGRTTPAVAPEALPRHA
jgi:hypothetical protein